MTFDLESFSKGTGAGFNLALKAIPQLITKENLKEYFDCAIQLLNTNIDVDNQRRVLITLCKTINEREYLNEFNKGSYFLQLPFEDANLNEQLFDVLYIIASNSPQEINSPIIEKFKSIIPVSIRKSLAILTIYGKNFESIKKSNWQEFLDILIDPTTSDYFKTRLYVKDYVSLLFFLCDKFPQYRIERLTECWDSICSCLSVRRDESLCLCYYTLIRLFDKGYIKSTCQFPIDAVSCHLRKRNVQNAALSLLMRMQPKSEEENISDLLNSLVYASRTQINANLVLVQMARDESISRQLVRDSNWMVLDLPTKVDTIRLFAVVMGHQSLRDELSKKNETLSFLRSICELNTPGIFSVFTTFVRRLPLDQQYVQLCSDYGLISSFFLYALEKTDDLSVHSSLLFIDTIARASYTHDLIDACDYVNKIVRSGNEKLSGSAMRVACDLAQYPKCAARFQKLGLDDWFNKNQKKNEITKKASVHFFRSLKKAYEEEKRLEAIPKQTENKNVESKIKRKDPHDGRELKPIEPIARNIFIEKDENSSKVDQNPVDIEIIEEEEDKSDAPLPTAIETFNSSSSFSAKKKEAQKFEMIEEEEEDNETENNNYDDNQNESTEFEENLNETNNSESTEFTDENVTPNKDNSPSSDEEFLEPPGSLGKRIVHQAPRSRSKE